VSSDALRCGNRATAFLFAAIMFVTFDIAFGHHAEGPLEAAFGY
jgi:hypothetical protein